MKEGKQEVITFKVDTDLAEIIKLQPNRSEFIRKAILNAIDNTCPLCRGTGIITPQQKVHWDKFLETHLVERCNECDAVRLVCKNHE